MKKTIIAIVAVVIIIAAAVTIKFTVFKSDKPYKDTEASVPVSEEQLITEEVGKDDEGITASEASTDKKDDKNKNKNTSSKKDDKADKKDKKEKTSKNNKKEKTTEKETTTEAPKKRDVKAYIYLPSNELKETKLVVQYKLKEKNAKWQTVKFDDPDNKGKKLDYQIVVLDGKTVIECNLGKFKGGCKVKCDFEIYGYNISDNIVELSEYDDFVEIHPYSGIERLEGGDD